VVAVSVDDPGNEDRIRSFVAAQKLTFEILNEGSGAIENAYQSRGIPSTFLIDRRGIIRLKVIGAADCDAPERRAAIEAVLNEASGAGQP
jgi:peroxiredoxin